MTLKYSPILAGIILTIACIGCGPGGPDIASVEGDVTLDGKPLPNASVVFIPENGRPAGATTDSNGHYVLNFSGGRQGSLPGKNKVRISTARDAGVDKAGDPTPGSPEQIPMKYNAQTTLEFKVLPNQANVANFDLESGGKLPPVSE